MSQSKAKLVKSKGLELYKVVGYSQFDHEVVTHYISASSGMDAQRKARKILTESDIIEIKLLKDKKIEY